jgi:hypothetical protein
VSIENSTIQGNESDYAAINTIGKLVVSGSTISLNTGGGLSVGGPTIISDSNISGNSANAGGGIYATGTADVDVTGGKIAGNQVDSAGGGIFNLGTLSLTDVTVWFNTSGAGGGGIYNNGNLSLARDTFIGNFSSSVQGAKIYNDLSGQIVAANSTFTGHETGYPGGSAFHNSGDFVFQNSTLWGNTFVAGQVTIYNTAFGHMTLANTLIGIADGEGGASCGGNPLASSNFSLFEDSSCTWGSGSGNIIQPGLTMGDLGPHGGLTWTRVPPADSPAVDAGQCNLAEDQRGVSRPQGPACDIGSVERRLNEGSTFFVYLPIVAH